MKVDGGLPGVVVLHVLQVCLDAPFGHRTNDEKDNDHRRDNEGGQLDGQIHFFVSHNGGQNTKKFFPEQFRFDYFVFYSMSSWFGRCSWQPFSVVVTIAKPGLQFKEPHLRWCVRSVCAYVFMCVCVRERERERERERQRDRESIVRKADKTFTGYAVLRRYF